MTTKISPENFRSLHGQCCGYGECHGNIFHIIGLQFSESSRQEYNAQTVGVKNFLGRPAVLHNKKHLSVQYSWNTYMQSKGLVSLADDFLAQIILKITAFTMSFYHVMELLEKAGKGFCRQVPYQGIHIEEHSRKIQYWTRCNYNTVIFLQTHSP